MKYAVTRLDLGRTRPGVGWVVYDDKNMAFLEMTPRDLKYLIRDNEVKGLKINENQEIVVDTDYISDLACKSGVGNYRLISGKLGMIPEGFEIYILVGLFKTPTGLVYEVITPFCQRFGMSENHMRILLNDDDVVLGGVTLEHGVIKEDPDVQHYLLDWPGDDSQTTLASCKRSVSYEQWQEILKGSDDCFPLTDDKFIALLDNKKSNGDLPESAESSISETIDFSGMKILETEEDLNEFLGLAKEEQVTEEVVAEKEEQVTEEPENQEEQVTEEQQVTGEVVAENQDQQPAEETKVTKTSKKRSHKAKA